MHRLPETDITKEWALSMYMNEDTCAPKKVDPSHATTAKTRKEYGVERGESGDAH
jgi:hypothetical protein